jgi:hypothetical protein
MEKENGYLSGYKEISPNAWSSIFEVSDIADFQIEIDCNEEIKEEVDEENKEEDKWYLPTQQNGMKRYLRVMITTKDDATLFIVF